MCKYADLNSGVCSINKSQCPFLYWCYKTKGWRENNAMPTHCKMIDHVAPPKGFYKVVSVRKGYLYIEVDDKTIKLLNPYNDVPDFVKLSKTKNGIYKIKEGDNNDRRIRQT